MGLLAASPIGFAPIFSGVVEALRADVATPAFIFGMAGSQKGWREVPYTTVPTSAQGIAGNAIRVKDRPATWLVGGVSSDMGSDSPEVMRGEEVQALGVLQHHAAVMWICLPGTHSKWVSVSDGLLTGLVTFMTGELFDWVAQHSIISTQITDAAHDPTGFEQGLQLAQSGLPLTNSLFQLRTRYLAGRVGAEQVSSMASGLLIGYELAEMTTRVGGMVALCGSPSLSALYQTACSSYGVECVIADSESATIAGMLSLSHLIEHDNNT